MDNKTPSKIITETDKIGIIGSPSSTNDLTIDILGDSTSRKLIGELSYFKFFQDGNPHYAIGQINEVKLNNFMLEDSTIKKLIRDKGIIETISGLQDTYRGHITISAVFGEDNMKYFPSLIGTVPPTGTYVHLVNDKVLDDILDRYREEIFYLGRVYGSTPKLPLWFKHFGTGSAGAGEAYHMGVFGKTGSGKSVLAKMLLLAYARHPDMAIYIIDPQAEFAMDITGEGKKSRFDLRLRQVITSFKKEIIVKSINELVLDGWPLFTDIIRESNFFPKIGIKKYEEKKLASEDMIRGLKSKYKTSDVYTKEAFFDAFKYMGSETSNERFQLIFKDFSYNQDKFDDLYETSWKPVCQLFKEREGGLTIKKLLQKTFASQAEKRPVVVLNLAGGSVKNIFWNEEISALVIKSFLDALKDTAEASYRRSEFLNTLVVLDEAHRLAPSEELENESMQGVRLSLIDAVRTTRKYGLGWMFISQTLASLPKAIVEQLRILFFGFGLAFGKEFTALKEIAGGDDSSLSLYQSFRDPHSAFDIASKQYNFMSIGPVSPLSFSGTPMFFTAYNTPIEFLGINRL
ncbi:MAG: ATP-binding protein, partial [Candidatus Latescibacteria bacterium]|nr:ATP-binding protein [Candidatus Latescibacterota bacterium]